MMSRCHTTALARGSGAGGAFGVAVALQAVVAAGGLLGALFCGGACQGLEGVVGLGAGG